MKKIIFIAISALTALFVSCDMNKLPYSSIDESQGIQSMSDADQLRVSIYSPTKGMFGGGRWDIEDMRGGMFNAMADFGNYYGLFYAWDMQTNDSDVESIWYADYNLIASMNYAIGAYTNLLKNGTDAITGKALTDDEKDVLELYIAEAYMTRIMAYWDLVTKFCVAYDAETAANEYGLPLVSEYAPTSDNTKYPGRSSLEETYQFILSDLEKASEITTKGEANSKYWTIDAVNAMRARVLLNMKDYANAADVALEVINTNNYALAVGEDGQKGLWEKDTSSELIFVSACNLNDTPTATGSLYIYDNEVGDGSTPDPQYIPSKTLLDLYNKEFDARYSIYYATRKVNVEGAGEGNLELFYKFQGNPALRTSDKLNYKNAGKPFRIAEMYLTLAECYAALTDYANAAKWVNLLRVSRIDSEGNPNLPATAGIYNSIKEEWNREYVGEGFRMINMKRWGDTVIRGTSQSSAMTKGGDKYDGLVRDITDSRCILPIPKTEIDSNPQIKNQQNPGY